MAAVVGQAAGGLRAEEESGVAGMAPLDSFSGSETPLLPVLVPLEYELDEGFGERARLGLIVLETDLTLEAEARMLGIDGVTFLHSRIAMDVEVSIDTLSAMEERLPAVAALLPAAAGIDAIGYGCTSAATLLGSAAVADAIQRAHPGVPCFNPISSTVAALRALHAQRVAVVTPYTPQVTMPIVAHLASAGFKVTALGSFLESNDIAVARIAPASIAKAVHKMAGVAPCDAVFVSCTNVRLLSSVREIEEEVGVPVISSNVALLWHMLRHSGVTDALDKWGCLFGAPLPDY